MNPPDAGPGSSHDQAGPVFAEPWQAQAFALAVTLSDQGHFTWKEWSTELAVTLKAAADRGEPDDGSHYYDHWLATLERLVLAKGLADQGTLLARKDAWAVAYRTTPHGTPVELRSRLTTDVRWLVPAAAVAAVVYWIGGHASAPSGFLASAGFGSLLGMRHAIEPDHLAAVSTLMTGERSSAKGAWLGACWGLGHTLTLMIAGALLLVFRASMPAVASDVFELCVVVLLVGFGVRAVYQGISGRVALRTHSHAMPGTASPSEQSFSIARRPLIVGAVHGLAGSGTITALVVTALPSMVAQISYLALFGIGTIAGMALLSGLLGWPLARFGGDPRIARVLSLVVGGISTALGLLWAVRLVTALTAAS